jgi:hypothetical protein
VDLDMKLYKKVKEAGRKMKKAEDVFIHEWLTEKLWQSKT